MRARASNSIPRVFVILSGLFPFAASLFVACGPAPVVVTDADQALLAPSKSTSSASAQTEPPPKRPPLLVPDQPITELPAFTCPLDKTLNLLGQTFCVVLEPRDWHEAEKQCQNIGAHLAVMKNSSLPNALREAVASPTGVDRFWIGLAEPSEGRWIWSNGNPMRFSAFRRGEPNNSGRGEDCAEWIVEDGRWNDSDCFQPRPFLCEAPSPAARSGAKPMTCRGRRFTIEKTDYCVEPPARWDVAQRTCVQNGGELAMIDTDAENTSLFKALGSRMAVTNLWIGLSDETKENQFRWISGEPLELPLWRPGEPNNDGGAENCVEWVADDGRWNDVPCSIPRASLCEKPPLVAGK